MSEMPAEFRDAPQVQEIAGRLIPAYHPHLADAAMAYVFRKGDWASKGDVVQAKAVKVSARDKYFHGYDFLVIVNEDVWLFLTPEEHDALIDHELCHCARAVDKNGELAENEDGSPKWAIVNHKVEEFPEVLTRHGAWNARLKAFVKAAKRVKVEGQATLEDYREGGQLDAPAADRVDQAAEAHVRATSPQDGEIELEDDLAGSDGFEEDGPLYPRHYCTKCRKQVPASEIELVKDVLTHVPAKGRCSGGVIMLQPGEAAPSASDAKAAS